MLYKALQVITEPNPILRQKSINVEKHDIKTDEFQKLVRDMAVTMEQEDGAGLAAPQISKNIRLIVINIKDGVLAMVNPVITKASLLKEWGEEGCLSVPGIFGQVKRHKKIKCKFLDTKGKLRYIEAEGMMARVIQHEIDHLNGILFIDKARNLSK